MTNAESCGSSCARFYRNLFRRKVFTQHGLQETKLNRVLGLLDLTALGVGSTLGAGVYVVAGEVAHRVAGPAVLLSFVAAGVASFFAALCYAEFGSRLPRSGSSYAYSYVAIGEFVAFVIGWNMLLEYVIGTSSVARACSDYVNSLTHNAISNAFNESMPINVRYLSDYPDWFAFGIVLLLTALVCVGIRESSLFNNLLTLVNLIVVVTVVICGAFRESIANWHISPSAASQYANASAVGDLPSVNPKWKEAAFSEESIGAGGFFPFGVRGMLAGAATCFYAFVGFDVIATAGEEVREPRRTVPLSIVLTLVICAACYCSVSATVTLLCPYFLLDAANPLTSAFAYVGWSPLGYVVAIGAICALASSLIAGMLPMPRVLYAMANDGLVFRPLACVSERFRTPTIATIVSGLLAATLAMLFDLAALVNMMSIGTLLAYIIVAVSVLVLRYTDETLVLSDQELTTTDCTASPSLDPVSSGIPEKSGDMVGVNERDQLVSDKRASRHGSLLSPRDCLSIICGRNLQRPTRFTARLAAFLAILFVFTSIALCAVLSCADLPESPAAIASASVLSVLCLIEMLAIWRLPQSTNGSEAFRVPLVPLVPCLSVLSNVFLMMMLDLMTWTRLAIWLAIGLAIYFGYGYWHSDERNQSTEHCNVLFDVDDIHETKFDDIAAQKFGEGNVKSYDSNAPVAAEK